MAVVVALVPAGEVVWNVPGLFLSCYWQTEREEEQRKKEGGRDGSLAGMMDEAHQQELAE